MRSCAGGLRLGLLSALLLALAGCSGDSTAPGEVDDSDFSWQPAGYTYASFRSNARGEVPFSVYLPPGWTPGGNQTYPLIFYLHGQGGNEHIFPNSVPAHQLNQWIYQGLVPPFVVVALSAQEPVDDDQWFDPENVALLTSLDPDELRAFCWRVFRAGGDRQHTSVHGQSRGASGALFFALNHWGSFASAVANAFVSDYVLPSYIAMAAQNREAIVASGILLRITIGSADEFAAERGRVGAFVMDDFLTGIGIPQEFEVLPGIGHGLAPQWFYMRPDGRLNGLYELQLHARAWAGDS